MSASLRMVGWSEVEEVREDLVRVFFSPGEESGFSDWRSESRGEADLDVEAVFDSSGLVSWEPTTKAVTATRAQMRWWMRFFFMGEWSG